MNTTATRTLLRQTGRVYEVARAGLVTSTASYNTRPICQRCLFLSQTTARPRGVRALHTSPAFFKSKKREEKEAAAAAAAAEGKGKGAAEGKSKGKGKNNNNTNTSANTATSTPAADDGPKHPQPSSDEPLNFADVESRLRKHAEYFKASFKKMHTSGRFDPDVIGSLRVTVDKKEDQAYPLRELAQVVPRGGRAVSLLVHDAEYVKPIMSAVQSSAEFNQQPQRDPDNELELVLRIEPESREDLVRKVKATAHDWRERVRSVRQKRDKLHATWKKDGTLGPDLKRTVDKELEKVIKASIAEIDEAEKAAVKVAESK